MKRGLLASCVCVLLLCLSLMSIAEADEIQWVKIAQWEITEEGQWISDGIRLLGGEDSTEEEKQWMVAAGLWEFTIKGGRQSVTTIYGMLEFMYLYFEIDDDIIYDQPNGINILIEVEYYSDNVATWTLNFDSYTQDWDLVFPRVQNLMEEEWMTAGIHINNGRFYNQMHGVSDFRLFIDGGDLTIRRLTVYVSEAQLDLI